MTVAQRETLEFRPVTVRDTAGTVYTGTWHYQITAWNLRPVGTWLPSVSHAARTGFVIESLTAGDYALWIRLDDDNPYLPVVEPVLFSVE
jgi:hypothetical protein